MDMFEQAAQQRDTQLLSETLVELSNNPKWMPLVRELTYLRAHILEVEEEYNKVRTGESNEMNTRLMLIYSDQIGDIQRRISYLEGILYKEEKRLNRIGFLQKFIKRRQINSLEELICDVEM